MPYPGIDWILTDEVVFMQVNTHTIIAIHIADTKEIIHPKTCVLEMRDGELTFDGVKIHTESLMGFLGIYDLFDDGHLPASAFIHHPKDA